MTPKTSDRFWRDKCVLITGASSGIGLALSQELGERGARMGLIARNEEKLVEVTKKLSAADIRAEYAVADVVDPAALRSAVQSLESRLSPCDVAVASAGIYRKTSVTNYDPVIANAVLNTNINGVSNLFAAVTAGMIERGRGHLAAVSSISGMLGLPAGAAYCASKAAVDLLCASLRVDLYDRGVRVTTICPGYIDTPMITDEERRTLKHIVSAPNAAKKIAWAIERERPEYAFPWQTWLEAKAVSLLPFSIYRHVMKWVGEMEETG